MMLVRTLALTLAAITLLVPSSSPAQATPDNFNPRRGPSFNNPLGESSKRRVIFRKLVRSINSSPRGSEIDIFSWNFLTSEGADVLIRAQRRGVRVRLLMDDRNLTEVPNPPFMRLRATLRKGNQGRPKARWSYARVCDKTCRGRGGAAHTKMFLFSRVGKRKHVVMHGSANFTIASTTNQWNDMFTHVGNLKVYRFAKGIFREAARDKPAARPYLDKQFNNFRLIALPMGKQRDPVMGRKSVV